MNAHNDGTSLADLASEVGGLTTGLGVLSFMWVPFAIPALLLGLLLVLPLILLAPPLLAAWLLVRGVGRLIGRRRSGGDRPKTSAGDPATPSTRSSWAATNSGSSHISARAAAEG
jgi:hypothetical protein